MCSALSHWTLSELCPCHLLLEKCCIRLNGLHRAAAAAARASLWGYTLTLHCFYRLPLWHFHSLPPEEKKKLKRQDRLHVGLHYVSRMAPFPQQDKRVKGKLWVDLSSSQEDGQAGGSRLCFFLGTANYINKALSQAGSLSRQHKGLLLFPALAIKVCQSVYAQPRLWKLKMVDKKWVYFSYQTAKSKN